MLLKVEFNRIAASLFLFPLKVMMYSVLNDPMTVTQRGLSLLSCAQGTRRCHVKILSYVADLAVSKVSSKQLPQLRKRLPQLRKKTKKTKKKRRVIVIGDSFLRGTEGPICRPDPSHREVCCLPGARVRDVAKELPGLVRPSDYYPLLVIQVGGD